MEDFLKELTELCIKYKVEIAGCGCCGSPFIDKGLADGYFKNKIYKYKEEYDEFGSPQLELRDIKE